MKASKHILPRGVRSTRSSSPAQVSPPPRRLFVVEGFFLVFGLCLIARLVYLQVLQRGKYQELARVQHHAVIPLPAQRGIIYDRHLNVLALNEACVSVGVDLRQVKDRRVVAEKVGRILEESPSRLYERMKTDRPFVWLRRRVDMELAQRIQALALPGLRLEKDARRRYPHREIAAHVLGFTDIDNRGIAGIEFASDSLLRGRDGRKAIQKDAIGNQLPDLATPDVPPVHGRQLVLTIDYVLQAIATEELRISLEQFDAQGGVVVVTDPTTGHILALVCEPGYDPNQPAVYSLAARRNRALVDLFEPGSTFKLATFGAALQEQLAKPGEVIFCENGAYKFAGQTITDHGERYGNLTLVDVVAKSSNIGTVKLARHVGGERIYRYARDFGFGMPTGLASDGEAGGVLKSPATWSGSTLAAMAMGYEVAITALQMAMAYGAVANGGLLLAPKIIAAHGTDLERLERTDKPQVVRRVLSRETARTLTAMFEEVVNSGTGMQATLPGVRVAGKTGTAHRALPNARGYSRSDFIASFVGYFPAEKPSYLIFVMLENPRTTYWGGMVAAPTFKRIAQRILSAPTESLTSATPAGSIPAQITRETVMDANHVLLPDLTNRKRESAEEILKKLGLEAVWDGQGEFVVNQLPPPGAMVMPRAKVTLELFALATGEHTLRMPQVTGLSLRQALQKLSLMGIDAHVVGSGQVRQQYPPAGTVISSGVRCELRCQPGTAVVREAALQQ